MKLQIVNDSVFIPSSHTVARNQYVLDKERVYIVVGGKNFLWFYPKDILNCGDLILRYDQQNKNGFGGSQVTLRIHGLETPLTIQGPWHSPPEMLLQDTGIDLTTRVIKQRVIAKELELTKEGLLYKGIAYLEEHPDVVAHNGRTVDILRELIFNGPYEKLLVREYFFGGSTGRGYTEADLV